MSWKVVIVERAARTEGGLGCYGEVWVPIKPASKRRAVRPKPKAKVKR